MEIVAPKPRPAWKVRAQEKQKEKYHTDPEYRKAVIAKAAERLKQRYHTDDVYRRQQLEKAKKDREYIQEYKNILKAKLAINQVTPETAA